MEQNYQWKLKKYDTVDEKQEILNLRKIVFQDEDFNKENEDFWNWEFENNYAGPAHIFLAKDEGKVVGHYAVCPSNIIVDGQGKPGSIVVDVMTHGDYRFQGMFTKIGRFSLDESGKSGIDFSYGFPIRKAVIPGHLKVGWKIAFPLPVYVSPIFFWKIINRFLSCKPISMVLGAIPQAVYGVLNGLSGLLNGKYLIRESEGFEDSPQLREFVEKTKSQHRVMQTRDFSFLKWRYNDNAYRHYHVISAYQEDGSLLGYIVLQKTEIFGIECITIMDIQAVDFQKGAIRVMLNAARRYAKAQGAALIGCMTNQNPYKAQLLTHGYLKSPYIFKFILHANREIDYWDILMENKNWFLTWADTDDL